MLIRRPPGPLTRHRRGVLQRPRPEIPLRQDLALTSAGQNAVWVKHLTRPSMMRLAGMPADTPLLIEIAVSGGVGGHAVAVLSPYLRMRLPRFFYMALYVTLP
jgi:hypothetical protein